MLYLIALDGGFPQLINPNYEGEDLETRLRVGKKKFEKEDSEKREKAAKRAATKRADDERFADSSENY